MAKKEEPNVKPVKPDEAKKAEQMLGSVKPQAELLARFRGTQALGVLEDHQVIAIGRLEDGFAALAQVALNAIPTASPAERTLVIRKLLEARAVAIEGVLYAGRTLIPFSN